MRGFERRLERLVEGTFSRVFRSGLKPVELGRRLTREMDANRSVGISGERVAPNSFTVELSPEDAQNFAEVRGSLERELADAAREHARDEGYSFLGPISVEMVVGPRLKTGNFRIAGRPTPSGLVDFSHVLPGNSEVSAQRSGVNASGLSNQRASRCTTHCGIRSCAPLARW